ncbi:hypothetical protein AUL39_01260 [Tractidigestivibacter scatoligenes]|uniref:APC family permease n=1 Tax=Tractidigestivibacter scatoligenes TaxID=1299998 RepID=A0A100YWJ1_TRASO|nr:APC family permease [Tractidigestivibacter scatoligenes]KUH58998.1 hypothetical protein AUL39_01260 [Tractidigestivibacter scatoligenes]
MATIGATPTTASVPQAQVDKQKPVNGLHRTLKLLYVYTLATGAIFTFMCYWDGIFMSYCGPATFLGFALMTLMVLPIGFVYSELSTMLPSTGSCLVFNTVGINKHAGFWSAWLIMCAWLAVPAAGVLGILDWLDFQFLGNSLGDSTQVLIGAAVLCIWCVISLGKNVVAGRLQTVMLFTAIGGVMVTALLLFFSGHWSLANFSNFFANTNAADYGLGIGWVIGCAYLITPYFGFECVPAMVEEGNFPIKEQKKAILGSVVTCGVVYSVFYLALAGCMDWSTYAFDGSPFITFQTLLAIFGNGGWVQAFIVFVGITGVVMPIFTSVLGFWYSGVRMMYAMGRQNFLPKVFSKCNRWGQPILPNILILGISIGFLAMSSIRAFFDLMAFACAICYAISSISALRLERNHPEWPRPYKCGHGLKVASLAISIAVAGFCLIGVGTATWIGFIGYMAVGAALWVAMIVFKWRGAGEDSHVWMSTPEGNLQY